MNNFKNLLRILLIGIIFSNISYSATPTYSLKAVHFVYTSPNVLEFDIYLKNTSSNPTVDVFEYSMGQFIFNVNPAFINGGSLTYQLIVSDLPVSNRPSLFVVHRENSSEYQLRMKNTIPPGPGNGPIILSTGSGTLIARMKLTNTVAFVPCVSNITWRNESSGGFYTKLIAYTYNSINPGENITNDANHTVESDWVLNITALLHSNTCPEIFTVELRNAITPYEVVFSQVTSFSVSGNVKTANLNIPCGLTGLYYIVLRHWNSIEVWSANEVSAGTTSYDFSTGYVKAYYGNEEGSPESPASLYRGDVNQDGVIDLDDVQLVDYDANFGTKGFVSTDLNCDDIVDAQDVEIVDNTIGFYPIMITDPINRIIPNSYVNRPGLPSYQDVRHFY